MNDVLNASKSPRKETLKLDVIPVSVIKGIREITAPVVTSYLIEV